MARANAAYYATHDPFADFTTAPEISQVFGEILGAWARIVWQMMGGPADIMLVEAGPGRGVLMADAKRAWPQPKVHLIETSPRLRAEQARRLPDAVWHDAVEDLPDRKFILLANEFLDALPVRQFIRRDAGWHERHVADTAYIEIATDTALPDDPPGSVREVNEPARAIVTEIARRGGVALFIDYGPEQGAAGASVQAIRAGNFADPLAEPGSADLTAHVDFTALAAAARNAGADTQGPIKQNVFLTALGLMQRTDLLARRAPEKAIRLKQAAQRLTAPEAMGSLFKAFAVCPAGFPPLPGFDA